MRQPEGGGDNKLLQNPLEITPWQKDPKLQELETILRPRWIKEPKHVKQTHRFYNIGQKRATKTLV